MLKDSPLPEKKKSIIPSPPIPPPPPGPPWKNLSYSYSDSSRLLLLCFDFAALDIVVQVSCLAYLLDYFNCSFVMIYHSLFMNNSCVRKNSLLFVKRAENIGSNYRMKGTVCRKQQQTNLGRENLQNFVAAML